MNEYIKKIVEDERTGANIVNIKVDTQSRYLFNGDTIQVNQASIPNIPIHKNIMYETLEKMALEIDSYKGKLEQDNLKLALAKEEQEFERKWSGVNDKFNDGKYEEYCKDLNELKKRKTQLISSNKYLTSDEKDGFFKNDEIRNLSIFAGMKNGRNKQVIKQTVDNVNANFEQRIDIMKTTDITNDKEREELMAGMSEGIQMLVDIGYLTQEKAFNKFVEGCASGYMGCINNYTSEVVARYKDNPSVLLNELNKIESIYLNDKNLSMIAQDVSGRMKSDNEEEGYKYTRALLEESFLKQFKTIKSETRTALKQEQARRRAEERERKKASFEETVKFKVELENAENENDYNLAHKLLKTGKKDGMTTYDINYYDGTVEKLTGKDISYFSDFDNQEVLKVVDNHMLNGIKEQKNLGTADNPKIIESYSINAIKNIVEKYGKGDRTTENAFIKDFAFSTKINPQVLKESFTDPEKAKKLENFLNAKSMKNTFSNNEITDDNLAHLRKTKKYIQLKNQGIEEESAISLLLADTLNKNPNITNGDEALATYVSENGLFFNRQKFTEEEIRTNKEFSTLNTNYKRAQFISDPKKQEEKERTRTEKYKKAEEIAFQ